MKRIYWETVKKWAIKAGIPAGVASFALLFMYLSFLGVMDVTGYSGDITCAGTVEDPCIAYINVTFTEDVFIYPMDYDPWGRDTPFYTDKELESWKIYRSWGTGWREIKLNETCTGTWCGAPDNKGVDYSFVFREGRDYTLKIEALKKDPSDTIKWGFGPVDPFWYGVKEVSTLNIEAENQINLTANMSGVSNVCVDIDHPEYGDNYTCGSPNANFSINITYFRKTELNDSSTETNLSFNGPENQTVYIRAHQYDNVKNMSLNLTGYKTNGTFPNVKIYINNSLSNLVGFLFTGDFSEDELSDGNTSTELFFDPAGEINSANVKIPKNAEVSSAYLNLSSYSQEMDYTGTSFDAGSGFTSDQIAYLDGYFWITDGLNNKIYKYSTKGVYAGTTLNVAEQYFDSGIEGYNETLWLVSDNNNEVRNYWTNGTLKSSFSTTAANAAPTGIMYYNGYFYIGDWDDKKEYQYWTNGTYTGNSWDVSAKIRPDVDSFTTNGTYIWYTDIGDDEVYKYYMNETYTGNSFDTAASGNGLPRGIVTNNTYFWTTDDGDREVYKYYMNGTYVGSFDTESTWNGIVGNLAPIGITTDNNFIWVSDYSYNLFFKYYMNGTYTGNSFNKSSNGNSNARGMTTNETYIWTADFEDDMIYKYDMDFNHIDNFSTSSELGAPHDVTSYGNFLWVVDISQRKVAKYYKNGTYTGENFNLISDDTILPASVVYQEGYFWAVYWNIGATDQNQVLKYWTNWTWTGESYDFSSESTGMSGITTYNNYLWLINFGSNDVYKYKGITYPEDPFMEVGIFDGTREWNYTGTFNDTERTSNFNSSVNDFLDICTEDSDGYCSVPIYLKSDELGVINISSIEINYSYDPNPVYLDTDLISNFLNSSSGYVDIPIKIYDSQNGTVTISDIRYDYLGGNDTIDVLVYEQGDKTNNESLLLNVYYSSFNKVLPYSWTEDIFFLPRTNSSKNVSTYKQSSSVPIFNITTTNYGNKDMNLSIKMNETSNCLNITWSLNSTKPAGNKINSTWQQITGNKDYLDNLGIWLWADLEQCNPEEILILNEKIELESYCVDCAWES